MISIKFYHWWTILVAVLADSPFDRTSKLDEPKKFVRKQTLNPNGRCSAELWRLNRRLQQIVQPLDLQGHWVSTRCEIHAGPKFVLRDYQFYKTGNFLVRHYEFSDEYCSKPLFGFTVDGHLVHSSKSWAVPGAYEASFTVGKIALVPYSEEAARTLTESLKRTCYSEKGRLIERRLTEYKDYVLYFSENENDAINNEVDGDYPTKLADFDCAHSANFSTNTLNLLRMDEIGDDRGRESAKEFFTKRLYFGKSVWDAKSNAYLTPSSFTSPLVNVDQIRSCKVCDRIKNAHQLSPPTLKSNKEEVVYYPTEDHLEGDWVSTSCESLMHGMYGLRLITFKNRSRRWKLRQRYFNDALCKHPSFTLAAGGRYSPGPSAGGLSYTRRILYKVERVKLVPESKNFVRNIQLARRCGTSVRWRKGRTVDVTEFGGCRDLGIAVPSVTRDVAKVTYDKDLDKKIVLYMGDYSSVEFGDRPYPTSFQPPLIKCDELTIKLSMKTLSNDVKVNYLHLTAAENEASSSALFSDTFYCVVVVCILNIYFLKLSVHAR